MQSLRAFSFQGLHGVLHAIGESFIQAWITLLDRTADQIGLSKLHRRFSNCIFLHLNFSDLAKCIIFSISSGKIWGKCGLIFGIRMTLSSLIGVWKMSSRTDNTVLSVSLINCYLTELHGSENERLLFYFLSSTECFQSGAKYIILSDSNPCVCISEKLRLCWASWL